MLVNILTDNRKSWLVEYIPELTSILETRFDHLQVKHHFQFGADLTGDVLLALSCERILTAAQLALHKHTLVAHPSRLPHGKGWSPLAWQILEGKNQIPISLFEASVELDAGDVYYVKDVVLDGTELNDEIKKEQARVTFELISEFFANYDNLKGIPQEGESTFYKRRRKADNEIDINRPLKEQFNLLRIVDNERYPAHFSLNGTRYTLKIYKEDQ